MFVSCTRFDVYLLEKISSEKLDSTIRIFNYVSAHWGSFLYILIKLIILFVKCWSNTYFLVLPFTFPPSLGFKGATFSAPTQGCERPVYTHLDQEMTMIFFSSSVGLWYGSTSKLKAFKALKHLSTTHPHPPFCMITARLITAHASQVIKITSTLWSKWKIV